MRFFPQRVDALPSDRQAEIRSTSKLHAPLAADLSLPIKIAIKPKQPPIIRSQFEDRASSQSYPAAPTRQLKTVTLF